MGPMPMTTLWLSKARQFCQHFTSMLVSRELQQLKAERKLYAVKKEPSKDLDSVHLMHPRLLHLTQAPLSCTMLEHSVPQCGDMGFSLVISQMCGCAAVRLYLRMYHQPLTILIRAEFVWSQLSHPCTCRIDMSRVVKCSKQQTSKGESSQKE